EHCQLALGQLVLVLLCVLRGDDKKRLLPRIGVAQEALGIDRRSILRQTTGPLGDAAIGITRLLGTYGRKGGTQPGQLLRRSGRQHTSAEQGQSESTEQLYCCFHSNGFSQGRIRSSRRH